MKQPKLKRFQHQYPKMVHGSPNGYVKRWAVYESEAKKAIEIAYLQGWADALREARGFANASYRMGRDDALQEAHGIFK